MKIGIVGLGLIGGSLARVMTAKGHTVYGADISPDVMKKATLMKAIDGELTEQTAKKIDMLIVAVYPRSFEKIAQKFLPYLKEGAVLSDICGNKRIVVDAMQRLYEKYPKINYLATHPMAGREYSGIERSSIRLFDGASIIFVPYKIQIEKLAQMKEFYLSLGFGEVVFTDAENHDSMIAYTSQLCHIVSNAFIKSESAIKHVGYSAGSYKDLTRVARLSSEMWAELMIDNKDKLEGELDNLINHLVEYKNALSSGAEDELKGLLKEGNDLKTQIDRR